MKILYWILGIIIVLSIGIYSYNYFTLSKPVKSIVNEDYRNEGIDFEVHYKNYINVNTFEFNLKSVSSQKAAVDVFRVLLQTSSALKNSHFEKVELEYNGTQKFFLKGDYFRQLGREYGEQNPVYVMRTFPENLFHPNGNTAYDKWEGGLLGVMGKQIEDLNDFHKKWYLNDMMREINK